MGSNPQEGLLEPMEFEHDPSSRKKKGAHCPVFAEVFQLEGESVDLPKKVHLLVNPFSGNKKGRAVAQRVIELVKEAGVEIQSSYSAYSGHLVTMASALVVGKDEVIAVVGGDGSLSEAITGRMLLGKKGKETFAIIPAGTGNSHAHDLKLSSVEQAVEAMLRGRRHALDLARVELTEELHGATGEPMVRYSHNLVTWGWALIRRFKLKRCDGWGDSLRCWCFVGHHGQPPPYSHPHPRQPLHDRRFHALLVQNTQTGGSMLLSLPVPAQMMD